jgi:hypothetical protein
MQKLEKVPDWLTTGITDLLPKSETARNSATTDPLLTYSMEQSPS